MSVFNQGIYERLAGDATLTAMLSVYEGAPSILLVRPVPTDIEFPYVTADEDIAVSPYDTKTSRGREINRSIKAFTSADSVSRVRNDEIIERIRFLFHRQPDAIHIDGFVCMIANVTNGPEFMPTDNRVLAQEIQVRLVINQI